MSGQRRFQCGASIKALAHRHTDRGGPYSERLESCTCNRREAFFAVNSPDDRRHLFDEQPELLRLEWLR